MPTSVNRLLYGNDDATPLQGALQPYQPLTAPSLKMNTQVSNPIASAGANAPDAAELAKWGYTGPLGTNDYEQESLKYISDLYQNQDALKALNPAQDYYTKMLGGGFGPESDAYLQAVLDPMRASSMQNYNDLSKALAARFSNFGGYYGGKSGVAQGKLAAQTAQDMAQQEANLRYQAFMDNINNMSGAATGLRGISGDILGTQNNYLSQLLGGGNLLTGREQYNTDQYQNAIMKSYQDWIRARQEQLLPYTMGANLLGTNAVENVVTQDPGLLASLLGAAGSAATAALL